MSKNLEGEAFLHYVQQGPERSYQRVAEHFGCAKRTVTRLAKKQNWAQRLVGLDREAKKDADQEAGESLVAMRQRHHKVLKAMTAKALETLRQMPLDTAMDAVRTLDIVLKQERAERGESEGDTKTDLVEIIRREHERWLVPTDGSSDHAVVQALGGGHEQ